MSDKRTLNNSSNSNHETEEPVIKKNKNSTSSVESVPNTNLPSVSTTDLPGMRRSDGSRIFAVNTLDDITELTTEYPDLTGVEEETFYFKIVEDEVEEDNTPEETSERATTNIASTSSTTDDNISYSTDITSFHQINLVEVIKSMVEDPNDYESELEFESEDEAE